MDPHRIAVHGAAGRMGKRVIGMAAADARFVVTAAWERDEHPDISTDAGVLAGIQPLGVPLTSRRDAPVDVVIDFSLPEATPAVLDTCLQRRLPLVIATTGLSQTVERQLEDAATHIPVVWAANMSLAVNLVMKLAQIAAQALRDHSTGVDVEIVERHHRFKEDAPSGTALKFGEIIRSMMKQSREQHGRQGRTGPRPANEIGYHALRVGDDPGQHTVVFGLLGETIELRVAATSRDCYAAGALQAARFLAGRPPGLYSMFDVLALTEHP